MRFKQIAWLLAVVCAMVSSGAYPSSLALHTQLSSAQVEALQEPIYTTQQLKISGGELPIATRDYGSGLELREAYVYCRTDEVWDLVVYSKTNSARVAARLNDNRLELLSKAGRIVPAIPVSSLMPNFDPKER